MRCWGSLNGRLDGKLELRLRIGDDRELRQGPNGVLVESVISELEVGIMRFIRGLFGPEERTVQRSAH